MGNLHRDQTDWHEKLYFNHHSYFLCYIRINVEPCIMSDLTHIKSQIIPILKKYGIKKAGIFGSAARGESIKR